MNTNFLFWTRLAGLALLLAAPVAARAQGVGVGTTTPDAKAALDIRATDKGLLIPRLTAAQRTGIASPPQGLLIYQTDGTAGGGPGTGFWYFGGSPAAWVFINPAGGGADNLGNHTATQPLNLAGQALTGTGASIGTVVGVGVRADGGLNLGQNTAGRNIFAGFQAGAATAVNIGTNAGVASHFVGYRAGAANTTGSQNQFSGYRSGENNTTGFSNHFSGYQSGQLNTTGNLNQFVGHESGAANTRGSSNQFSGYQSGFNNTTGFLNQFSGHQSGYFNTTGIQNQFSGYRSGFFNTRGSNNLFSGYRSGENNMTGDNNWAFGYEAGPATGNLINAGAIGTGARVSQSNSLVLGATGAGAVRVGIGIGAPADRLHVYGAGPTILRLQSSDGFGTAGVDFWSDPQGSPAEWRPAFVRSADAGNFTGQLRFYTNGTGPANRTAGIEQMRLVNGGLAIGGTAVGGFRLYVTGAGGATGGFFNTSDARLKTNVRPLTGALALVQALRGVRYQWNALGVARGGAARQPQVGLLAQELARVLPELVSTGPDGYQAVNYAQLAPVLVEALKELASDNDALRRQLEQDRQQFQQQRRQDRAAAEAQAVGFAQRLRALEAASAQAAAGH